MKMDQNEPKRTQRDQNVPKQTKTDQNRPEPTKTDQNGLKRTKMDRNAQNWTKHKNVHNWLSGPTMSFKEIFFANVKVIFDMQIFHSATLMLTYCTTTLLSRYTFNRHNVTSYHVIRKFWPFWTHFGLFLENSVLFQYPYAYFCH